MDISRREFLKNAGYGLAAIPLAPLDRFRQELSPSALEDICDFPYWLDVLSKGVGFYPTDLDRRELSIQDRLVQTFETFFRASEYCRELLSGLVQPEKSELGRAVRTSKQAQYHISRMEGMYPVAIDYPEVDRHSDFRLPELYLMQAMLLLRHHLDRRSDLDACDRKLIVAGHDYIDTALDVIDRAASLAPDRHGTFEPTRKLAYSLSDRLHELQ